MIVYAYPEPKNLRSSDFDRRSQEPPELMEFIFLLFFYIAVTADVRAKDRTTKRRRTLTRRFVCQLPD